MVPWRSTQCIRYGLPKTLLLLLLYNLDNCVDRHVELYPDRIALIWEKDEPKQHENITYR